MNRSFSAIALVASIGIVALMGFYRERDGGGGSRALLGELRQVPGVVVSEYSVVGRTLEEVQREIRQRGPKDFYGNQVDAYTAWRISWRWPEKNGKFDFSETTAEYAIEVSVPRWEGLLQASHDAQGRWEQYIAAIARHERRHVDFVLNNYQSVATKVREAAARTPGFTTKDAHRVANDALAEIRKLDREYDESTERGRIEGVVLVQ